MKSSRGAWRFSLSWSWCSPALPGSDRCRGGAWAVAHGNDYILSPSFEAERADVSGSGQLTVDDFALQTSEGC
jgi:hypothetical protein